ELAHLADVGRATTSTDTLVAPRPEVWDRIRAELGFVGVNGAADGPAPGATAVIDLAARQRTDSRPTAEDDPALGGSSAPDVAAAPSVSGVRRWLSMAVAACLALVVGVGLGLGWDRLTDDEEVVATAELAPGGPEWTGASGEARVEVDDEGRRYLVVSVSTPRPTDERQVWLISDTVKGAMKNLGALYENGQRFRVDGYDLTRFPLVDISDEPDANPAHSGNTIVRGPLQS
ncbi:MAG: anti-sigma factor, partial [Actinomycetes bacterium]